MFPYKISVIIPVYNCERYIDGCIESLFKQSMPAGDFEVLLIDDGSPDGAGAICDRYAAEHDNIRVFHKENGGVSSTRNLGIEHAAGKYFLFLDADDTLTPDTLSTVYRFFEWHYDEVDMVTYRIIPVWKDKRFNPHYRYKVMNKTGVYDLEDPHNWYLTQTTMNVCVKNMGEGKNILFDTTLAFHEDQKYCFEVLSRTMKLGYCHGPEYLYLRHPGSATGSRAYAYYIFEKTMNMWEEMFGKYADRVPPYLQALYLNDLNWKTVQDVLLPYHYQGEQFDAAVDRINALVRRCDDEVIMNHPMMDLFLRFYFLRKKGDDRLQITTNGGIKLLADGKVMYESDSVSMVATRLKVIDGRFMLDAFVKSPIFFFNKEMPRIFMVRDGVRQQLQVTLSDYSYYRAQVKTCDFWRITVEIEPCDRTRFYFEVEADGVVYRPSFYFMPNTCFDNFGAGRSFFLDKVRYSFNKKKAEFRIDKKGARNNFVSKAFWAVYKSLHWLRVDVKLPIYRAMAAFRPKKQIWLYQDRDGVRDNAYQQFCHDFGKQDGITRYYVLYGSDFATAAEHFTPEQQKYLVRFHSMQHKYLYLNCNKILISFSNLSNICPFGIRPMQWYYDLTRYELVYLQHGILHASLPTMYSKERSQIDRVVVSSHFEVQNMTTKYGYADGALIKSGMPRFDFISPLDGSKKRNRILLSPSWRANLIGPLIENTRQPVRHLFMQSQFYKEMSALIQNPELIRLLEENDLYLDFKNHPIFKCYNELFEPGSDRITVSTGGTNMDDYLLMITDYSSIVFDAVYMGCPIAYFVPDYDMFVAGVSHNYRRLDLPLEQGFGPFTRTADELLQELKKQVANKFVPEDPYRSRMEGFFLHREGNCRDRLYDELMGGK